MIISQVSYRTNGPLVIVYSLEHKAMCQIRIRLDNVCNLVNTMYANVDCF